MYNQRDFKFNVTLFLLWGLIAICSSREIQYMDVVISLKIKLIDTCKKYQAYFVKKHA